MSKRAASQASLPSSSAGEPQSRVNPAEFARLNAMSDVFKSPRCFRNQSEPHKADEVGLPLID